MKSRTCHLWWKDTEVCYTENLKTLLRKAKEDLTIWWDMLDILPSTNTAYPSI